MKKIIHSIKSSFRRAGLIIGAAVLAAGIQSATAQSIGCHVVTNSVGGIDNAEGDSMLPADSAGVPSLAGSLSGAQTNWNNFSRYGSGTLTLTSSLGTSYNFDLQWDSGFSDTTGTWPNLGTPDGELMDAFMSTWGPGAATPLANSVYNSSINNKPLVYIGGLNAWWTSIAGAEGYDVVLYTTGYTYYETVEGYLESVTGSPLNNTMVEGSILLPPLYQGDSSDYTGTYVPVTSTSSSSPTYGANYMFFTGLTNDAILIRLQTTGYGQGLNAFQFVPVFPTNPVPNTPTFSPASEVYAQVPVTITETASGDPFHTNLWYQWFSDDATGGGVTNAILDATNSTFSVVPTNNAATYYIQYLCVVTNIFGASTSSVVSLTVDPAVAPFVTQDTTPGPGDGLATVYAYAGGTVSFSAAFGGTPPTYLWQSNSVNLLNATSTTLTLTDLTLSASADYDLTATNSVGGNASTPTPLVVQADPPAPDTSVAYPYDVYTNGPVAYWRFGETIDTTANSVQAYDYSGNNNDATYGIEAYDNAYGPQSPQFPGFESTNTCVTLYNNYPNSFLTAPSLNLNTNTVTITAWIYPNTIGANWGLFMWRGTNGDAAGFGFGSNLSNGVAELGYTWNSNSPSTYNSHSGLYPPVYQWSFVALTITPTNSTIYLYYIDQNSGVTNLWKSVQNITNQMEAFSGGTIWIGSDSSISRNFNGSLDEVAVFNKSLSENQIQNLFQTGTGIAGVAPSITTDINETNINTFVGQPIQLTASGDGAPVPGYQWQSGSGGVFNNILNGGGVSGANSSTLNIAHATSANGQNYRLLLTNTVGSATSSVATVTLTPVPTNGLWTVNFQATNNTVFGGDVGSGAFAGQGALGTGTFWNIVPDNLNVFSGGNYTNLTDFTDNGVTHSGIGCIIWNSGALAGTSTPAGPTSVKTLLDQWETVYYSPGALEFTGVPDGTYNLALYGANGGVNDAGSTFVVHGSNGTVSNSTANVQDSYLSPGDNTVIFTNVAVSDGTLSVDIDANTNADGGSNTVAVINAAQIQLVSYAPLLAAFSGSPTNVFVTQPVTFVNNSTGATNWVWNFGDSTTLNTSSSASVNHAYASAGTYTVSLTAIGSTGTNSTTNTDYIVVSPKPAIASTTISNGNVILGGVGGIPGVQYRILTSTNLALPLADWTAVLTNEFAPNGSYGYTNSSSANNQSFFIMVSP